MAGYPLRQAPIESIQYFDELNLRNVNVNFMHCEKQKVKIENSIDGNRGEIIEIESSNTFYVEIKWNHNPFADVQPNVLIVI